MQKSTFKLGDKIIHSYEFWDRETKKEIIKEQKGIVISFSFNYKEENPIKIYTIKFENGQTQNFIDKKNPNSKKYFAWDIQEIKLIN